MGCDEYRMNDSMDIVLETTIIEQEMAMEKLDDRRPASEIAEYDPFH